ncbi:MAG TPA: rhodanese-like domain-containing protein [Stellaceae bacterium]|nr:rhodanese-like domain-containing protein [Stellaceae bacterium]
MPRTITAPELRTLIESGGELALIDVREELPFSEKHLLHARSLPLSRLELRLAALVPRRATPIVVCDDGEGLAERAAEKIAGFGYADVSVLEGGVAGWGKAGFTLFSGTNVPSKAFGEWIEHESGTPSIDAKELHALMERRADMVVLDSRPWDEYHRIAIPSGIDVPGAELVLRARDLAPDPATLVVVNCAGRTRSIIGAQSLIDAGLPNKVVALRNGTMGWTLAGFEPAHGADRKAPAPSPATRQWAKDAARKVADRCGVKGTDEAALARWQADETRTTYLFDVRDPPEYEAGHLAGAISAPGGQLVQATDQYAGTMGSRIVLNDPLEARALMTGAWLKRMGWREVYVLAAEGRERGFPQPAVLGLERAPSQGIDPAALADLLARGAASVVDLGSSKSYRDGHIAGAWFAIRSRLKEALPRVPKREMLVLTSEDGNLARLAVREAEAIAGARVTFLADGTEGWKAAGRALAHGAEHMADEPMDLWLKAYERQSGVKAAMEEYLAWELDLLHRIKEDGTCRFTN